MSSSPSSGSSFDESSSSGSSSDSDNLNFFEKQESEPKALPPPPTTTKKSYKKPEILGLFTCFHCVGNYCGGTCPGCNVPENGRTIVFRKKILLRSFNLHMQRNHPLCFKYRNSDIHNWSDEELDHIAKGLNHCKSQNPVIVNFLSRMRPDLEFARRDTLYEHPMKGRLEYLPNNITRLNNPRMSGMVVSNLSSSADQHSQVPPTIDALTTPPPAVRSSKRSTALISPPPSVAAPPSQLSSPNLPTFSPPAATPSPTISTLKKVVCGKSKSNILGSEKANLQRHLFLPNSELQDDSETEIVISDSDFSD